MVVVVLEVEVFVGKTKERTRQRRTRRKKCCEKKYPLIHEKGHLFYLSGFTRVVLEMASKCMALSNYLHDKRMHRWVMKIE